MSYKLVIAEKPSVAPSIAKVIGADKREDGYLEGNCKMSQIAIAWQWAKGILSPIIGATKTQYLDDSAGAFDIKLTAEDLAYLEEPYVPHEIVGAIDKNPAQGVILLDEKK